DYSILPNPAAQAIALAQPTALVFDPSGNFFYVAAFGSDRVAKVSANGSILSRIPLGLDVDNAGNKRGPRGLALDAVAGRLYVLNRISNSLSVIYTATGRVLSEQSIGTFDPTPSVI